MIFAVVGPSGAGKDTLMRGAAARRPDLRLVRRVITRPVEAGGEDYEGVSEETFTLRLNQGEFALHWRAHGLHYGIPRSQVTGPDDVIFNGSRGALPEAMVAFPGLKVILVTAPEATLAARLAARGRETVSDVGERLSRARFAMPAGIPFATVMNDGTTEDGIAKLLLALQPVNA
jgi:ribose 1,5-bisphosphokinase